MNIDDPRKNDLYKINSNRIFESSINTIRSLEDIYEKNNALLTREISRSKIKSNYDSSNILLLVETETVLSKRPKSKSIQSSMKYRSRSRSAERLRRKRNFENLVFQNMNYLNHIASHIKRDYDIKKVILHTKKLALCVNLLKLFNF